MSEKIVKVKHETWKKLCQLKMDLEHKSLDQTIKYLFYELEKEGK